MSAGIPTPTPPTLFVGSSSEAKDLAKALASLLSQSFICEPWWDAFPMSELTFESIEKACARHSFGVFIGSTDDFRVMRGTEEGVLRDNVLCEFFMFVGKHGRDSTFLVVDEDRWPALPTDMKALTVGTYSCSEFNARGAGALAAIADLLTAQIWTVHKEKIRLLREAQRIAESSSITHDIMELFSASNVVRNMLDVVQHDTLGALADEKRFAEIKDAAARQIETLCEAKAAVAQRVRVESEFGEFERALAATVRLLPYPSELISDALDAQALFEDSILGNVIHIAHDVAEKNYPGAIGRAARLKGSISMEKCAEEMVHLFEERLAALRKSYADWWRENSKRVNTALTKLQEALMRAQTANALALAPSQQ